MDEKPISANELRALNSQIIPNLAKDLAYKGFWYYTRLSIADKILHGNSFWVRPISDMNDLDELELHVQEKDKIHALCFCNSEDEKIPMWYLYSGITGKGAALGLTPGNMLAFLRSLEKVEGVREDETTDTLMVNQDILLRFGWIYYQDQHDHSRILYKNKWYKLTDAAFEYENYFIKNYPWEYEREFRLVFINQTKINYKHLIVKIPESLQNKIKLRLAPELKDSDLIRIKGLDAIRKDMEPAPIHSKLKIKMDLLHRNKEDLPEYLPEYLNEEFMQKTPGIQPEALCNLIQDARKCQKSTL